MIGYGPPGRPGQFPPRRPEEELERRAEEARERRLARRHRLWVAAGVTATIIVIVLVAHLTLHLF